MPPDVHSASDNSSGTTASTSTLAGGRFAVDAMRCEGPFAKVYRARDTTTDELVSVHVLHPHLAADRTSCERASGLIIATRDLRHPSIVAPRELITGAGPALVVTDLIDGHTLAQLLQRKRDTGTRGFTPRGARNIATQLLAALTEAEEPHGALTMESVSVDRAGHVSVSDFAMWPLVATAARNGSELLSVAPEVRRGEQPTHQSDVYSVGAILYELVIGEPPRKGCARPSEVVDVTDAMDTLIARCVHDDPAKRISDLAELAELATKALSLTGRTSAQTPAQSASSASSDAARPRPSLAQSIASPRPSAELGAQSDAALQSALTDTEERWLISKDKLDYGPFSLAEVVEQIRGNEILPGHYLIDNHNGDRTPVEEHPLIAELVDAARQKRDDERRAQAEVHHAKVEKRRGTTLYAFIAAGVVALGLGAYGIAAALKSDSGAETAKLETLDEANVQVNISGSTVEEEPSRRSRGRKPRSRGNGGSSNSGAWDAPMDLGDVSRGGGDERLDMSQINPVLQRNGGKLGRCLTKTGSRQARIRFIIKGTGRVSYVDVNGSSSSALAKCVRRAMGSMKFPSFDGVRTRSSFNMSL